MGRDRQPSGAPKWPRISPKSGLRAESLLPDDFMIRIPGCLTAKEAEQFIAAAESVGFQHQGSRGPAYGEAYRDNHRIQFTDQAFADSLWRASGLAEAVGDLSDEGGTAVGLNPNIRIYRYAPGQRFGRHIDESNDLGGGLYTCFTLLVYLSSCGGGETVFYGARNRRLASVAPAPGLALLHKHGDDCLDHEGAEVKSGVKYVLRSDVVFRRRE